MQSKPTKVAGKNPERARDHKKRWADANIGIVRASRRFRKIAEIRSTPSWLSAAQKTEITEIYEEAVIAEQLTGVKHHVDHIEPVRGKDRCGLHVPWNLQILTAEENLSKGNRPVRHFHWKKLLQSQ